MEAGTVAVASPASTEALDRSAGWVPLRLIGVAVCAAQLSVLIAWSYHLWSRFALATDVVYYAQAWHRIGTGHLNPYSSIEPYNYPNYGHAFIRGHFELVMWPLSLLHLVWSSPFALLVIQDLALAGIALVTYLWAIDIIRARWSSPTWVPVSLALLILAALVFNPYFYETASFDFHLEDTATLFLVLAAWSLWKGQEWRALTFAFVTLLFGGPVALYVVGIGLAAAVVAGRRRGGLMVAGLGCAWLLILSALNMDVESHIGTHYGYLIGRPNAPDNLSVITLALNLLIHPANALHVLRLRAYRVYSFLASGGLVGVLSPWGFLLAVTVLLPNALNSYDGFISVKGSFQSLAAVPFIVIGSVVVGLWVAKRFGGLASGAVLLLAVSQVTYVAVSLWPGFRSQWPVFTPSDAKVLSTTLHHLPSSAEVIGSPAVLGRFGARQFIYPAVYGGTQVFPVKAKEVVFILADDPDRSRYLAESLHAELIGHSARIDVFRWRPPAGTRTVNVVDAPA